MVWGHKLIICKKRDDGQVSDELYLCNIERYGGFSDKPCIRNHHDSVDTHQLSRKWKCYRDERGPFEDIHGIQ